MNRVLVALSVLRIIVFLVHALVMRFFIRYYQMQSFWIHIIIYCSHSHILWPSFLSAVILDNEHVYSCLRQTIECSTNDDDQVIDTDLPALAYSVLHTCDSVGAWSLHVVLPTSYPRVLPTITCRLIWGTPSF